MNLKIKKKNYVTWYTELFRCIKKILYIYSLILFIYK